MKPEDISEIESLLADYFVRDLTEEELEQLEAALAEHPELRKQFAEHSRDEWLLHHIHADMVKDYVESPKVVSINSRGNFMAKVFAVAAMIAVTCSLAYLVVKDQRQAEQAVVASTPSAIQSPKLVATLIDAFTLPGDHISVSNGQETRILDSTQKLFTGDTISVPEGARMSFQYAGEETVVRVNTASEFTLSEIDGAKQVHLASGILKAEVVKQPEGKPMRLTTNDAEAVVLGTSFELRAKEFTQLAVLTGLVGFNSLESNQTIYVEAGHLAQSNQTTDWQSQAFAIKRSQPIFDHTLNKNHLHEYIAVDHKRGYVGFLRFNCGEFSGDPIEAKLKLRVTRQGTDSGGNGTVRLYKVPPSTHIHNAEDAPLIEVASYTGRLGAGMDLEFDIDTESIQGSINTFLIKIDDNGNDFWLSSSKGPVPPQLILKVDSSS
ncbi:MAG: FecR domain-containing protein [Opitutaceae bacterium]